MTDASDAFHCFLVDKMLEMLTVTNTRVLALTELLEARGVLSKEELSARMVSLDEEAKLAIEGEEPS
jgi:hypothetical protein